MPVRIVFNWGGGRGGAGLVHATGVHKRNTVHVHKFAPQRKARFWCNSTG